MIQGLRAALNFPHDEGRLRLVPFMTDGFIGNQQQVLTTLHHELGTARTVQHEDHFQRIAMLSPQLSGWDQHH